MKLGFIGGGKMAAALIKGVLKSGICTPADITVCDVHAPTAERLRGETGVTIAASSVEVVGASGIDDASTCLDRNHLDRGLDDRTGEPHTPDGGPEQVWMAIRANLDVGTIGQQHGDALHVIAERALTMVVLPMNVARDRSPDRYESRPRGHRHEVATRHGDAQQIVDADTRSDRHSMGGFVEDCITGRPGQRGGRRGLHRMRRPRAVRAERHRLRRP